MCESNEILRRMKTTHLGVNQSEMERILMNQMDDWKAMGYAEEWVQKVLKSATVGYMRILSKVRSGESPRNGKGAYTLKNRNFKKLVGLQEWFRLDSGKPDAWEVQPPWART